MTQARKKRLIVLCGLAALAVTTLAVLAWRYDLRGYAERVVDNFRAAGPWPFFGAMAILPGVGFPLSGFLAVAGPVFGPTLGLGTVIACGIAAVTVNVALSYWAAARGLRPLVTWVVMKLGYGLPDIPPRAVWPTILVLRLVPVTPFCVQSLLLGLARVPFGAYMIVSVLVPSTHIVLIITLGDALVRGDRGAMAIAGGLILVIGVVLHILRKRLRPGAEVAGGRGDRTADEPSTADQRS